MARTYTLATPGLINGDQLVAAVQAAHGIDISNSYGFIPPDKVEVTGHDQVDLQPTISAHDPEVVASVDGDYIFKADGVDTLALKWRKRTATVEPPVVIGGAARAANGFAPAPNIGIGDVVVGPTTNPGPIEVKIGNTRVIVTAVAP